MSLSVLYINFYYILSVLGIDIKFNGEGKREVPRDVPYLPTFESAVVGDDPHTGLLWGS